MEVRRGDSGASALQRAKGESAHNRRRHSHTQDPPPLFSLKIRSDERPAARARELKRASNRTCVPSASVINCAPLASTALALGCCCGALPGVDAPCCCFLPPRAGSAGCLPGAMVFW